MPNTIQPGVQMRDELTLADLDYYERTGEYPAGWSAWGFRFEITRLARFAKSVAPEVEAKELSRAAYLTLTESNGVSDNEWRTHDGVRVPEFPIASFWRAIDRLNKARMAFDKATGFDSSLPQRDER